jgi:hypothetical protein
VRLESQKKMCALLARSRHGLGGEWREFAFFRNLKDHILLGNPGACQSSVGPLVLGSSIPLISQFADGDRPNLPGNQRTGRAIERQLCLIRTRK